MKKVACIGIMVADAIVGTVNEYPKAGELLPVKSITLHNGGNAMTAAININTLGVEASVIGAVGNDVFGKFLIDKLTGLGINTDAVCIKNDVQTSASVLFVDETGERSFFHCKGANGTFSYDDIDFDIIDKNDLIFVTGSFLMDTFDGENTMKCLKKCKEMGKTTFLDVCWDASGKWGEILDVCMPYIDYFMPSIDEAKNIAKKDDLDEMADVFMQKGVKNVVIKVGSKGAYLRLEGEEKGKLYPAFKGIKAIDTTGAGDSFCSGFLAMFARDGSPEECVSFANATGALSVMATGATEGMKPYEEVLKFIKEKGDKKC